MPRISDLGCSALLAATVISLGGGCEGELSSPQVWRLVRDCSSPQQDGTIGVVVEGREFDPWIAPDLGCGWKSLVADDTFVLALNEQFVEDVIWMSHEELRIRAPADLPAGDHEIELKAPDGQRFVGMVPFISECAQPSSDTGSDTDTQSDSDGETSDSFLCEGKPDFAPCGLKTAPDRAYDICVSETCVSPGCGAASCNAPSPHFPLADTNQRLCYNNDAVMVCPNPGEGFYGQDAQHGRDVAVNADERYTRTTPVPDEPVVIDEATGLVWQGCAAGLSGSDCHAGGGGSAQIPWSDALAYCDLLDWGGQMDWRLPDPYELSSIVDNGTHNPSIDSTVFPGTPSLDFWSSSSHAVNPQNAWYVSFGNESVNSDNKTSSRRVRCVRSGPFEGRRFHVEKLSNDRIVQDTLTGLAWQGCPAGVSGFDCDQNIAIGPEWKDALAYCEGLSLGGYTDWRVPNRVELQSIVDLRRVSPSIDTDVFPATDLFGHWSSSSTASQPSHAWFVNFNLGQVADAGKTSNLRLRCVRGDP